MSLFNRLFGRNRSENNDSAWQRYPDVWTNPRANPPYYYDENEQTMERYRHILRHAPRETIERGHEEAFRFMSPEQRAHIYDALSSEVPQRERQFYASEDPRSLARMATNVEMKRPGTLERYFGGNGMGIGGTLMASLAAGFVGSMIAQQFMDGFDVLPSDIATLESISGRPLYDIRYNEEMMA